MNESLTKVALVTGAARCIGLAVARRFLAEGWRVALLDIDGKSLHDVVASLAGPENTLALQCDVADATAVNEAIAAADQRFGRLDALVNNAGVAVFTPFLEHRTRIGTERRLTTKILGTLISKITREAIGVDVSPHLFRAAGASTAAAYGYKSRQCAYGLDRHWPLQQSPSGSHCT
jgi:NAD(P)-dependent dehydrogenase (short-subunit alcohol dehydrogenase family)